MKNAVENLYLQYVNEFLTVERFAEFKGFTIERAKRIIGIGRKINHRKTKTIVFVANRETEFPQDLIKNAPKQGPFDEFAEYILSNYTVKINTEDAREYLKECGVDGVESKDEEELKSYLLWISILDCKENETNYWYMGV